MTMKKFGAVLLAAVLMLCMAACGAKKDMQVFDYINQLSINSTVEDINAVVGFAGVADADNENHYVWQITEETSLVADMYSDTCNLRVETSDELLKSSKVSFDRYDEIDSALDSGESMTYEEMAEVLGDAGYMVEKGDFSTSYRWVAADGGYLRAIFSASNGKCTMISGWF